jgi:hypothetical protein
MKSSKTKQKGKEELRKAQKSKKSSKSTQKLKINTPPNTQCKLSPLDSHLSCFFYHSPD